MSITVQGLILDSATKRPIEGAHVEIYCADKHVFSRFTDARGRFTAEVEDGVECYVIAHAFGDHTERVPVRKDCGEMHLYLAVDKQIQGRVLRTKECGQPEECHTPVANQEYEFELESSANIHRADWISPHGVDLIGTGPLSARFIAYSPGHTDVGARIYGHPWPQAPGTAPMYIWNRRIRVAPNQPQSVSRVALQRSAVRPTQEEDLWTLIRANSRSLRFEAYRDFINRVLCTRTHSREAFPDIPEGRKLDRERSELSSAFGVGAYELLKTATDLFLLLHCRTSAPRVRGEEFFAEEEARRQRATPRDLTAIANRFLGHNAYIEHVIQAAFPNDEWGEEIPGGMAFCDGVLLRSEPCLIELIWSYWHEEAMLVQSVNALSRRFQNRGLPGGRDPLAHFELDPLRPLNNILWGYVQEEYKRLSVPRRSLEYSHHYGLTLFGKANPRSRSADPRSPFLESFHNLLHRCAQFFKEDNDTTVIADGFPLLNALKEVHLVLSQGAHNQFGDLPWTARGEMLIQQWIMARPETRDFLQSRAMVRYTEPWMPQTDTMKTLQAWTDITVERFHDLAIYGEQILLSIRWGNWVHVNDEDVAKNWARYWRPEIQSYLHSYRGVSGVDLTNPDTVDATVPAVYLQRRLDSQVRAR